jgi:tetratricopeptide (TPR) repeat protein
MKTAEDSMNARRTIVAVALCVAPTSVSIGQGPAPASNPGVAKADSLFAAGNFRAAFDAYSALTKAEPNVGRYWYRLGLSAYNTQRIEIAADAFERSAAIGQNPNALYNAAAMHARLGHAEKSFEWLEKAAQTGAILPAQAKADSDFVRVRDLPRFEQILTLMQRSITPCKDDPDSRRFDFWIGEWDVKTVQGALAGRSVIEPIAGGCGLLENWFDGTGIGGKSLNSYNRAIKQWQQFWVGRMGEVTEYRESSWENGSLIFRSTALRNGAPSLVRLTFTPRADGTVRQFGEMSVDSGRTWSAQYELIYHRKKP